MAIFLWRGIFCSTFEDTDIVVSAGSYDADYVQGRSRASCSNRTEGAVLEVGGRGYKARDGRGAQVEEIKPKSVIRPYFILDINIHFLYIINPFWYLFRLFSVV